MKKLLLLLTLSFFSIQGYAASCPDGNEPTKTVSDDGSYFVYKCASTSAKKSTDPNREYFKVLNLLDVDDQYLINLLEYSASKIKNIPANLNIFAFFLPVGEWTKKQDTNVHGDQQRVHKVILNKTQMDNIFNELDDFVTQVKCFGNIPSSSIKNLKFDLKKGFPLNQYIHLCNNSGIIVLNFVEDSYPVDESSFNLNHKYRNTNLSHVVMHEAYHAFQRIYPSYLGYNCSASITPNYSFLTEGGAVYFAAYYQLARLNKLDKFDNYILRQVTTRDSTDSSTVLGGGDDWHTQHMPGLGAIILMIQKGWVDQSSILNGSFFNDCTGVRQFLLGSTKLKYLNDNWWKIERHNGNFRFNPSLSIEDEAKTYYYMMGSL